MKLKLERMGRLRPWPLRLLAFVGDETEDGCWPWTGSVGVHGYGVLGTGNQGWGQKRAHRLVYEFVKGEIADGHEVHHTCRNTLCVNPAHLKALSRVEHGRLHHPKPTHCKRGHPFDEANTYIRPSGGRRCRICQAAVRRRFLQRQGDR